MKILWVPISCRISSEKLHNKGDEPFRIEEDREEKTLQKSSPRPASLFKFVFHFFIQFFFVLSKHSKEREREFFFLRRTSSVKYIKEGRRRIERGRGAKTKFLFFFFMRNFV
uniref:Uncharacterized protein n=1 Tax=Cacopsylla melanoneura TaxID=428564 RepID=A0A8D8ZCL3_9HEMI